MFPLRNETLSRMHAKNSPYLLGSVAAFQQWIAELAHGQLTMDY